MCPCVCVCVEQCGTAGTGNARVIPVDHDLEGLSRLLSCPLHLFLLTSGLGE